MRDSFDNLYHTIINRKEVKADGSYTSYLFEQGLDKILKKIGEESSEVLIAAKNGNNTQTIGEVSDLIYHLFVLMVEQGISVEDVRMELDKRSGKAGNLKSFHVTDKNS